MDAKKNKGCAVYVLEFVCSCLAQNVRRTQNDKGSEVAVTEDPKKWKASGLSS